MAAWAAEVSAPRAALAVPKHFPQPNASHDLRGVGEWVEVVWMDRLGRNTEEGTENRSVLCVRTLRVPSHKHKCFHSGRVAALLRTQVFQTMEERRMKSEEDARAFVGPSPAAPYSRAFKLSCEDLLISSFVFGVSCQHLLRSVAELGPKRSRC